MFSNIIHSGFDLSLMMFLPLVGIVCLFVLRPNQRQWAWFIATLFAGATFAKSLVLLLAFDPTAKGMQFAEKISWIPAFGINYSLGIDGISIWLVVLTTFLTLVVVFASQTVTEKLRAYLTCLLLLETGMLGALLAMDGILFYIFWELMLVPMYFLIGIWGGKRRVYAALKFVLFTASGSLLMLVAIVYLANMCAQQLGQVSFAINDWVSLEFSHREELLLFSAFLFAFAIKVPIFPLHTWLPDAHVEAPTGGSVILAGVLLKFGIYGLMRFGVPIFPEAVIVFSPVLAWLGVVGIIFGALMAWVQTDMKKLVAYSSVSHLGFCVLGFAAMNKQGFEGAILQMINHGISTAALFLVVGVLYERKHTRLIADYGGLAAKMPAFATVFLIFTLSSIGLPLTNGFIGEFLLLYAGFSYNSVLGTFAVSGVILGAMYMLSLYRRVVFGPFDLKRNGDIADLSTNERLVFAPLIVLVFLLGLYPKPFLERIAVSSAQALYYLEQQPALELYRSGEIAFLSDSSYPAANEDTLLP
ncbi:MAG: NADH-quinone oxidoreductase subunit M [Deltaproteobacteria bacterium]|nr:NADH-quinone oxidoreductase subunit M [Deltaproteobacteria bacterium]